MKTDGAAAFRIPAAPGQQILQVRTADGARETPVRIEAGGASTVEWAAIAPAPKLQPPVKTTAPALSPEARESQDWERARKSGDSLQVEAFLRAHPDSRFAADARSFLDESAWERTNQSNALSLQDYLTRFPRGAHAAVAQRIAADLEWNGVRKDDASALRAFIAQNPANPHKAEAQSALDKLSAAAHPPPPPPQQQPVSPEAPAVREAIERFNAAFLHRSLKELKRAWASPPANWQDSIQQHGAISIPTLYPAGQPDIRGDRASWRCELTVQNIVRGQPQAPERKTVYVTLAKSSGGWMIENIGLHAE
jgi:hypothetical protein